MDDVLDLAAGLVRGATSGKPFETDRERVEHHVRRALGGTSVPIVWEDSMRAGVRRVLEILAASEGHASRLCREPETWAHGETGLTTLARLDRIVLDHGRAANRAALVTPSRRIGVDLTNVPTPVPVTATLLALIDGTFRGLLAAREPRRWRRRPEPIERRTRELALAGAAGLITGYRVDSGLYGSRLRTLVLVPRPLLRVRRLPESRFSRGLAELHANGRPAVEWPDGTTAWYWEGVGIPNRLAERLDTLTPCEIASIANQEVRRRVLDRVGWERFLGEARKVAQDDFGTLWRSSAWLDGELLHVVEVVNATREPDGTYRRYFLRVPPGVRTAREAVAWTFGYGSADEYILAAAS